MSEIKEVMGKRDGWCISKMRLGLWAKVGRSAAVTEGMCHEDFMSREEVAGRVAGGEKNI